MNHEQIKAMLSGDDFPFNFEGKVSGVTVLADGHVLANGTDYNVFNGEVVFTSYVLNNCSLITLIDMKTGNFVEFVNEAPNDIQVGMPDVVDCLNETVNEIPQEVKHAANKMMAIQNKALDETNEVMKNNPDMSDEEKKSVFPGKLIENLEAAGFKNADEEQERQIHVDEAVGEDKTAVQEVNPEEAMKELTERLEKIEEVSDKVKNEEPENWPDEGNDGAPTTNEED